MIAEAENIWMKDEENRSTWSEELGILYYRKATLSRAAQPAATVKALYRKSIQYGYKSLHPLYLDIIFDVGWINLFLIILIILLLVLLFVLYRIRIARTRRW